MAFKGNGVIRIEPFIVRKETKSESREVTTHQEYSSKLNLKVNTPLVIVAAKSEKSETALFLTIRARVTE